MNRPDEERTRRRDDDWGVTGTKGELGNTSKEKTEE